MRKRAEFVAMVICAVFISIALAMPVMAQEKKQEKKKDFKMWGTLVAAPPDASGKLASVALESEKKEVYGFIGNAVAKKLEKLVGQKVEVTGQPKEMDGKKAIEAWTFVRKDRPDAPTKKAKADAG